MGVATGCGCKEVYRFPHTTYPYSSCICSFLQQHPSLYSTILHHLRDRPLPTSGRDCLTFVHTYHLKFLHTKIVKASILYIYSTSQLRRVYYLYIVGSVLIDHLNHTLMVYQHGTLLCIPHKPLAAIYRLTNQ